MGTVGKKLKTKVGCEKYFCTTGAAAISYSHF
jgi:hypothetical protein